MCPSGAQSGAQKWGTWLKVGHIYYIKWGTTKYVPHWGTKWGTKVGHICFQGQGLKCGTIGLHNTLYLIVMVWGQQLVYTWKMTVGYSPH